MFDTRLNYWNVSRFRLLTQLKCQRWSNRLNSRLLSLSSAWLNLLLLCYIISVSLNIYFYTDNKTTNDKNGMDYSYCMFEGERVILKTMTWGDEKFEQGICLCQNTVACQCFPSIAVDMVTIVIDDTVTHETNKNDSIELLVVDRKEFPFGYATVGGFIDSYESIDAAVRREYLEETSIDIDAVSDSKVIEIYCFSEPRQDPRRASSSCLHLVIFKKSQLLKQTPKASDDAKDLVYFKLDSALIQSLKARDVEPFATQTFKDFLKAGINAWNQMT